LCFCPSNKDFQQQQSRKTTFHRSQLSEMMPWDMMDLERIAIPTGGLNQPNLLLK
jgi:hypothetical protein